MAIARTWCQSGEMISECDNVFFFHILFSNCNSNICVFPCRHLCHVMRGVCCTGFDIYGMLFDFLKNF